MIAAFWVGSLVLVGVWAFVFGYGLGGLHEVQADMHQRWPDEFSGPTLGPLTKVLHGRPYPPAPDESVSSAGADTTTE